MMPAEFPQREEIDRNFVFVENFSKEISNKQICYNLFFVISAPPAYSEVASLADDNEFCPLYAYVTGYADPPSYGEVQVTLLAKIK